MDERFPVFEAILDLADGKEKSRIKVAKKLAAASSRTRQKAIMYGLRSKKAKVRRTTLALIGEMRDPEYMDEVIQRLHDSYADVVQMAVWVIGRLKWREALPKLMRLIQKSVGFKVIKTVIWAFGEIGDPSVVPLLSERLKGASARLCEGILVCGIKLGYESFLQLVQSLDPDQPSIQSALRDTSYASGRIRGAWIHAVTKTKDHKQLQSILKSLPFVTFHETEYKRLLEDEREVVRLAVYQSIARSALPMKTKQTYLVQALSDRSNRVVICALEHLEDDLCESVGIKSYIEYACSNHPSPKVKQHACSLLKRVETTPRWLNQVPKWGFFLLETLPGLEPFVAKEAELLGISFQTETVEQGWLSIQVQIDNVNWEDLKKCHTIRRICGVVRVNEGVETTFINPYLDEEALQILSLEKVILGHQRYEVVTLIKEQEMIRPPRKRSSTSLDWRVARAMVMASKPHPHDVFVDPTCGSGTLLLDRMAWGPYKKLIGGDQDSEAIHIARKNLARAKNVQLVKWDATSMGLEDDSVTVVMANLPFGRRVGNHEANVYLYPKLVKEMMRVLCVGGRAVLLTQEVNLLMESLKPYQNQLAIESNLAVKMGGLVPHIICLKKKRNG